MDGTTDVVVAKKCYIILCLEREGLGGMDYDCIVKNVEVKVKNENGRIA